MLRTAIVSSVSVAALATAAHAGPAIVSDPTELNFHLADARTEADKGITGAYHVTARGLLVANQGAIGGSDRVTLTWSAGGKPLETVECKVDGGGDQTYFNCEGQKALDTYGAITARLDLTTDADDRTVTLSTHQLTVGRFWNWYERKGKRLFYPQYQVVPLDLLTSAVVWHEDHGAGDLRFNIYGWASLAGGSDPYPETMRCTVDGKRLPDVAASYSAELSVEASDWRDPQTNPRTPQIRRYHVWVNGLRWGTAADVDDGYKDAVASGKITVMGEHPGHWSCDLRDHGKAVRTFVFDVGKDGRVPPHPEQAAGFAIPGGEAVIDALVPDSAPDPYVDPAAVKAGGFWGQAWRAPGTAARLTPTFTRAGFEAAPPKGAKGGKAAKATKTK